MPLIYRLNDPEGLDMALTAVATDDSEPQAQLFQLPVKISEKRASLASVKGIPLPDDFEGQPDQPVTGTFVGDIKGHVIRRANGVRTLLYEIQVAEVSITPSEA